MRATEHLGAVPTCMQVLDSIGATWGRSRLMRLSGRAEVTSHVDINYYWRERVRVHVPIVTQPTVRFICGDAEVNMRAGECWIFDTWREHNVINDHYLARIHLVADTVGGDGFWQHVRNGRPHDRDDPRLAAAVRRARSPAPCPTSTTNPENVPTVMTPWEIRAHYAFLLGEAVPHPDLPLVQAALLQVQPTWQALWSCYGESRGGLATVSRRARRVQPRAGQRAAPEDRSRNGVVLGDALQRLDHRTGARGSSRSTPTSGSVAGRPPVLPRGGRTRAQPSVRGPRDPVFDRPVFIVSPPRSGSTMLFETLAQSPATSSRSATRAIS